MARREPDQFIAPIYKECIGAHDDGVSILLDGARECCVDIAFAACIQDHELNAECARCSLDVSGLGFRGGILGVGEEADYSCARDQLAHQFQSFCPECVDKKSHARNIAAGTVETGNETGSAPVAKTIGMVAVAALAANEA